MTAPATFYTIQQACKDCNINRMILLFCSNFQTLTVERRELIRAVLYCLETYPTVVSDHALDALTALETSAPHWFTTPAFSKAIHTVHKARAAMPNTLPPGTFPVVSTTGDTGYIHQMRINKNGSDACAQNVNLLDIAGSAVETILKHRSLPTYCFHTRQYGFTLETLSGATDPSVTGNSMGVSLALALFSTITGNRLPVDVAASGDIKPDGTIHPVSSIDLKLQTLQQERSYIKRVFIAASQIVETHVDDISLIRINTLEEAVNCLFNATPFQIVDGPVPISETLASIETEYRNYQIPACIKHAKQLIAYLKNNKHNHPDDYLVSLLSCGSMLGSCYCHLGDVRQSAHWFKTCQKLWNESSRKIPVDLYGEFQNRYGVLLKDLFQYEDAKKVHAANDEKMKHCHVVDHIRAMNISSLSQLTFAMGDFDQALAYQQQALTMIHASEKHRNYSYLARIYIKQKTFDKAKTCLQNADNCLAQTLAANPWEQIKADNARHFLNHVQAEFLYHESMQYPEKFSQNAQTLFRLWEQYDKPTWYIPALIGKFAGLTHLWGGNPKKGNAILSEALSFFISSQNPVIVVLGITVLAEKVQIQLKHQHPTPNVTDDLTQILSLFDTQLNTIASINHHFRHETAAINAYLKTPDPARQLALHSAIGQLIHKIPY